MAIQVKPGHNKFYIGESENKPDAQILFSYYDTHVIDVYSTYVSPSLRGGGVAQQLFNAVLDKAKTEELKIIPSCSYVAHQFERDTALAPYRAES
ncbi:GNAT family N-acetyltransferase [Staphylococcus lutrae]|uniref:GNAT family N-acetyltransferase n=1 Tax=Staphylococcus lutrae TaxID=155085 RepID=A0AAC9WIG4_9STAP|nr:GNAT family N-acetyltransferase [Staphylococcus lutrae]ARJ50189.1 GNAT family N-acetyltransferase [Staphylococcus lutrae]PNZ39350.1 N-acetyltransferase [Staphylococcus lutrae]